MTEHDPLDDVLREWRPIDPSPSLDARVLAAYRKRHASLWARAWHTRVSIPVPVLVLAALVLFALVLWFRPSNQSSAAGSIVTQVDSGGFLPLPHGEARVIAVKEFTK
jgi:hypothetical protein